ncbi:MAG: UDP-N-acetylglucosamine diphosphorylase/glucosamine-1-phosphate N-acetyltransferase, partial [Gammaproteobacteria bacterium]
MSHPSLEVIVLAAGKGTRMQSRRAKVMHMLAGRPLLAHVLSTADSLSPDRIHVVIGFGANDVQDYFKACPMKNEFRWVRQEQQLGTGHAVKQALPFIDHASTVLILYGDVPLVSQDSLNRLVEAGQGDEVAILTAYLDDPRGYGRIYRDESNEVRAIIEEADASPEQREISEVNTGFIAVNAGRLKHWLDRLDNQNRQNEYYLTDIISMAVSDGFKVKGIQAGDPYAVMGVNSRQQLSALERHIQRNQAEKLMQSGVTLMDPERFDLRGTLRTGQDVVIDVGVVVNGHVDIGNNVYIGAYCVITDSVISDGARIESHTVIEGGHIGSDVRIGPFARIRPGARLDEEVRVGNFVEVKNSSIGQGSKVNHLSYIGDATVGKQVNIGAGTITCNYDGANKHHTDIGDHVFVGSSSQLVA